jgi:hypothetical protein
MLETYQIVLLTLAAVAVLVVLGLFALGGMARVGLAWQAFRKIMGDPVLAEKVRPLIHPPPPEPAKPPKLSGEPLRLLAILQRDSRLLDFLLEDLPPGSDEQVGAFVRVLHQKGQQVIKEHLTLEPILKGEADETVEVPAGFDPSAIRVVGNVVGDPPFKGVLKHNGWRVKNYKLPAPPAGHDDLVVYPAEVEIP